MKKYGWLVLAGMATISYGQDWNPFSPLNKGDRSHSIGRNNNQFLEALEKTRDMVTDSRTNQIVKAFQLDIVDLTWEDTGRYKNSSVGPNISDLTIQVAYQPADKRNMVAQCMPVVRFPNFSDKTGDIDPRSFSLMVGNHNNSSLKRVSLYEYLENPTQFMSNPRSWKGSGRSLLSLRDENVLISAQSCFLPIQSSGITSFNPVIFNYQSSKDNPAVLTILATREGTSMTVIDNSRDRAGAQSGWGQRLFHNQNGQRASLTGQRLSHFAKTNSGVSTDKGAGLDMVMIIQVPLKTKPIPRAALKSSGFGGGGASAEMMDKRSNVETAVIGHGDYEGPFTEVDNLAIERDERFPVRVTVQFYKATSNGIVDRSDMSEIRDSIDYIYRKADTVGSLVTEGNTGRPTEYWGSKVQPASWWQDFWNKYEVSCGKPRKEGIRKLEVALGRDYEHKQVSELYLRELLAK